MQNFFETSSLIKESQEISNDENEKRKLRKQEQALKRKEHNQTYHQLKVDPVTGHKINIIDPDTGIPFSEEQLKQKGINWITQYEYQKKTNKKRHTECQKKYDQKLLNPETGLDYQGELHVTPITMAAYKRKKLHKRKVDPQTGIQIPLDPATGMECTEEQLKMMNISWITQQDYNAIKRKESHLDSMISPDIRVKYGLSKQEKQAEKLIKLKSRSTIVCPKTKVKITDPEAIKRGEGKTRSAIYSARSRSKYKDIRIDPKTEIRITDPLAIERGEGIKLNTFYKTRMRNKTKSILVDPTTGIELTEEEKKTKKGIQKASYARKIKKKMSNNPAPEATLKIEPDLDNDETSHPILEFDKKSVKKIIATLNINNKNRGLDNCAAFSEQILRYFLTGKKPPDDIVLSNYSEEQFSCKFFYDEPVIKIEEESEGEERTKKNSISKENESYHPEKIEIFRSDIYKNTILGDLFSSNILAYEKPGTNVVEPDSLKKIIEVDYCTLKSAFLAEIDQELKKLATEDPNHVSFGAIALARFGFEKKKEATEEIKIEDPEEQLQRSGQPDAIETEEIGHPEEKILESKDSRVHFKIGHLLTYFATPEKVYYIDPERWRCIETDRSIFHNLDKAFKFDVPANSTNTMNSAGNPDKDVFSRRIFYTPLDYHPYVNKKRNQSIDLNEDKLRHLNSSSEKKNKKFKSNLDHSGNAQVKNYGRNSFLFFEQQADHGKSLINQPSSFSEYLDEKPEDYQDSSIVQTRSVLTRNNDNQNQSVDFSTFDFNFTKSKF